MGAILVVAGLAALALPGGLHSLGRQLAPRAWARLCAIALVGGAVGLELGLLAYASPTVFHAMRLESLVWICERMLGKAISGDAVVGWLAFAIAAAFALIALGSLLATRRIRARARVDPSLLESEPVGAHGLAIVPTAEMVALSIPGRGGQVVVSTGLLDALEDEEVAVVLAHEAAHLDQHHHRLLAFAGCLRAALFFFPPLRASIAALQTALERCADEVAIASADDGRARLSSALRRVVAREVGFEVAALSGADTIAERLDALAAPTLGLGSLSRSLLYAPGTAIGLLGAAGLGICLGTCVC